MAAVDSCSNIDFFVYILKLISNPNKLSLVPNPEGFSFAGALFNLTSKLILYKKNSSMGNLILFEFLFYVQWFKNYGQFFSWLHQKTELARFE